MSFETINVVILDTKTFLVVASVADATAVNRNGIKEHLGDGLSTFFIKVSF